MNVNEDFVATVFLNENHQLEYVEVPIPKHNQPILSKMIDMCKEPDKTVLDLQEAAKSLNIPKNKAYNVCLPYAYSASYVNMSMLLADISSTDYSKMCEEEKKNLISRKEAAEQNGFTVDMDKEFSEFTYRKKYNYLSKLIRYVGAYEYSTAVDTISSDARYKMYSSENIGWTDFDYQVFDDVKFTVSTNFCYGNSAFFRVNLLYKGVPILPYSDIVRYYYANMRDLCRFTRQYSPKRENWPDSLKFVVETTNLAQANPEEFINTWIKNELDEMMKGLIRLKNNVTQEIGYFENHIDNSADNYLYVRNINSTDVQDYKAYPKEMATAYKAYKISGALNFLENLTLLTEKCSFVNEYINEIKRINKEIQPEVECVLKNTEQTLANLLDRLEVLNKKKEAVEQKMEPFKQKLQLRIEEGGPSQRCTITQHFIEQNPSYGKMLDDEKELQKQINELTDTIRKRDSFRQKLEESRALIIEKAIA